jgi:hypothetical protein
LWVGLSGWWGVCFVGVGVGRYGGGGWMDG